MVSILHTLDKKFSKLKNGLTQLHYYNTILICVIVDSLRALQMKSREGQKCNLSNGS